MIERVRCGAVEVEAFVDAAIRWPLGNTFPDASAADLTSVRREYPGAFEGEFWLLPVHCYVARTPERVVLFDAGLGASVHARDRYGVVGALLQRLAERGVHADEFTDVVFTHLHGDHMGGSLVERDGRWAPAFTAARYHLHAADWRYLVERSAQGGMAEHLLALERLADLRPFDNEPDLGRGVRVLHTPGHTPGSVCAVLGDAAERVLVVGDAIHHPAHVAHPNWRDASDRDAARSHETRVALTEMAVAERMLVAGAHFPAPFGRLARADGAAAWSAA